MEDFSFKIDAKNSASPRVLVNKRTGESNFKSKTCSTIFSATSEIVPSTYFISTSYFLTEVSLIISHFLLVPTTNFPASSKFPTVADNPILVRGNFEFNSNRSILRES